MEMWTLGVDFGTSATGVAVSLPGQPARTVNFGTASAMPSAILAADDGSLVIGLSAVNQRRRSPERFEAYPKRHMGEATWFLGRPIDPVEAVAAILRAAAVAAARQFDGRPPARVVLTHPAGWEATKLDQFTRAAAIAGLGHAILVPEPLAAAAFYAAEAGRPPVRTAAVYDLGGGTFDAAVVDASSGSFTVRRSAGLDWVGGVAFDHMLLELVGDRIAHTDAKAWDDLSAPITPADLQARSLLVDDIRSAKEMLSERQQTSLFVPMINGDVLITRREFENAVRADIEASVELFATTVTESGCTFDDLSAVYLVGGSSAIPLVNEMLFRRLGRRPVTRHDPKAVVALGAAAWPGPELRQLTAPPSNGARSGSGAAQLVRPAVPPGPPRGGPPPPSGPPGFGGVRPPPPPHFTQPNQQPAAYPQVAQPAYPSAAGPSSGATLKAEGGISPKVLIGGAIAAVLVVILVVVLITTKRTDSNANGLGTTPVPPPSSSGTPSPTPTTAPTTSPTTVDASTAAWSQFSAFSSLVGKAPGDTSSAYENATCVLLTDATVLAQRAPGSTAAVTCVTAVNLDFTVYLFPSAQAVSNITAALANQGYTASTWNSGGAVAGKTFSGGSTTVSEIATTFDALPTFALDMQSSSPTTLQAEWKKAPLPS